MKLYCIVPATSFAVGLLFLVGLSAGFTTVHTRVPVHQVHQSTTLSFQNRGASDLRRRRSDEIIFPSRSSTSLQAAAATSLIIQNLLTKISNPTVQACFVLFTVSAALIRRRQRLFATDPSSSLPLPDGNYGGCPLFGNDVMGKDQKTGLTSFFFRASKSLGNPGIFKCLAFGNRLVVVSGSKLGKQVLSSEFKKKNGVNTGSGLKKAQMVTGRSSLLFSQEEAEHNYLRRLVGQAMTPESITKAIPTLQSVIQTSLDKMIATANAQTSADPKPTFCMENVCTEFTLDVAHSQILGLDLKDEELDEFRRRVNDWIWGSFSPRVLFLPFTKQSRAYQARIWLTERIERKIQRVRETGVDDGSTLSAMVFAKDEESEQRLTDIEIIDNALLLILAGSETSASTLTNAMLFMGLHPSVYQKVQEEQQAIVKEHGSAFTRSLVDKRMPYLEAVIKETMRIRPISSGAMRIPKETFEIDDKQVPAGVPIAVNIQLTHELDPSVYQEDGSHMDVYRGFLPERWLAPADSRPSTDYMPFGWGPRYCLGANLAMLEMKLFLAMFARQVNKFDLVNYGSNDSGKKKLEWKKLTIVPKPKDGSQITIEPWTSPMSEQRNSTVVLDGVPA